jgi:hypothetical protein
MSFEIAETGDAGGVGAVESFVRLVEGYYGRYREPILRREVVEWIGEEGLDPSLFRAWYKLLVRTISREYNCQPDIVQLGRVYREASAARAADRPEILALDTGAVLSREEAAAAWRKLLRKVVASSRFHAGLN